MSPNQLSVEGDPTVKCGGCRLTANVMVNIRICESTVDLVCLCGQCIEDLANFTKWATRSKAQAERS